MTTLAPTGNTTRPADAGLLQSRSRRVLLLLIAIAALSLGDLYMTLTHLTEFGMLEANPIARLVMSTGSPALLAFWKISSILVTVGLLYLTRHKAIAEIAAVFCVCVLVWLTFRWAAYSEAMATIAPHPGELANAPRWVTLAKPSERD